MPINIQGKEYFTVVERLGMLKEQHEQNYSINTTILESDDKRVVVKATLSINGNEFTGLAEEVRDANFINKTSALENCETSAIGRSLSAAGYYGTEFCSANELEVAIDQQKNSPKAKLKPIPENVNPITGEESDVITFGKHKGKNWKEVDEGWLNWIVENNERYKDKAQSVLDSRSKLPTTTEERLSEEGAKEIEKHNEDVLNEEIPF